MMRTGRWTAVAGVAAVAVAGSLWLRAQNMPQPTQLLSDGSYAPVDPSQDPPSRVARLAVLVGNVSLEPASVEQFSPAEANWPLTTGDRLYAATGSNAELQAGDLSVRTGQQTDLTVTAMTDTLAQFGLAQGAIHVRSYNLSQNETVEVDTPNVAVSVLEPGDFRVDVDNNGGQTVVKVLSGRVEVQGNGLELTVEAGQRVMLGGGNPVWAQWLYANRLDGLDRFSADRDQDYEQALSAENGYVASDMVGAEDLNAYGTWDSDPELGPIWVPTQVEAGWAPYTCGHWTWIHPWGWTWVGCESWGFAPYHYGRWSQWHGRWGWIPGPVGIRPVYAPALVVFVGGGEHFGWFPLGPREVYQPWYHTSVLYQNRVNVTNIYVRNVTEVRNVYNNRTTNVFVRRDARPPQFVNREATVAVRQEDFAHGRPVHETWDRNAGKQLAGAPVIAHPTVLPERQMVTPSPARVIPPRMERPVLQSHESAPVRVGSAPPPQGSRPENPGGQPAPVERGRGNQPGAGQVFPTPNPVRGTGQVQPNQQPTQQPGQQPTIPTPNPVRGTGQVQPNQQPQPTQQPQQPGGYPEARPRNNGGNQQPQQPTIPTPNPVRGTGQVQPNQQPQPAQQVPIPTPNPARGVVQMPANQQPQQQQPGGYPEARPLYNRAVPPQPRPDFEQQRQQMQRTEPGHPLSPQQVEQTRPQPQQPTQQPQQQRQAPQPQPQQRPAPPAQNTGNNPKK